MCARPSPRIQRTSHGYEEDTLRREVEQGFTAKKVICAIPVNNVLELYDNPKTQERIKPKLMTSEQLNSAFQLSFVFKKSKHFGCLHHQIHLEKPLFGEHPQSVFLSLSHPEDTQRCGADEVVASVSMHVKNPAATRLTEKSDIEESIFRTLEQHGFFRREEVLFHHASTPGAWKKWTQRAWGFVGGYPQYMRIKPWNMLDARLDFEGAYLAGDSSYPGQGIPGATLSGIIAAQKLRMDG